MLVFEIAWRLQELLHERIIVLPPHSTSSARSFSLCVLCEGYCTTHIVIYLGTLVADGLDRVDLLFNGKPPARELECHKSRFISADAVHRVMLTRYIAVISKAAQTRCIEEHSLYKVASCCAFFGAQAAVRHTLYPSGSLHLLGLGGL